MPADTKNRLCRFERTSQSSSAFGDSEAGAEPLPSGIQKQVLSLYREYRCKPQQDRSRIESIVTSKFRRNAAQVDLNNLLCMEYLLCRGKKQLDQLKSPYTNGLSSVDVDPSSRTRD